MVSATPANQSAERFSVGKQRVAGECQTLERSLGGLGMTSTTRIGNHDRKKTEIGRVANRRLNSDLHGYANDSNGHHAAVPQRKSKRGSFKCRHRKLVE